jgi:hypothetical protein
MSPQTPADLRAAGIQRPSPQAPADLRGDANHTDMVATASTWWRPHRHGDSSRLLLMEAHDLNALHRKHLLTCGMSKMIMEAKSTQYAYGSGSARTCHQRRRPRRKPAAACGARLGWARLDPLSHDDGQPGRMHPPLAGPYAWLTLKEHAACTLTSRRQESRARANLWTRYHLNVLDLAGTSCAHRRLKRLVGRDSLVPCALLPPYRLTLEIECEG